MNRDDTGMKNHNKYGSTTTMKIDGIVWKILVGDIHNREANVIVEKI